MSKQTSNQRISDLIASRRDWHGLQREFYVDEDVYHTEIQHIWKRGWLFIGHTCEIPEPGDYLTFEIDSDSVIVIRCDDDSIRALYNVCAHRGTMICQEETGHVGKLVCPYHQWTYGRDGALLTCRGMHSDIDKSQLGLQQAQLRELDGLIYVSLADDPPDFETAAAAFSPLVKPQGFDRAKVAKIVDYEVAANWKLVWENNRECYHCNVNHPQYIKANFDHYNADDTTERIKQQIEATVARSEEKWAAFGLSVSHKETGMACFPDSDRGLWYAANRTALVDGYVSESMDGRQVAPLMGDYTDPDIGTLRMRTVPNFWNHSSCDHGVSTRLLPAGPKLTRIRVTWLVDHNAAEGKDYELNKLLPFWQLTSEQDWDICELAQRGIQNSRYRPGPLSTYKEYNVNHFLNWYLKQLAAE